MIVLIRRVLLTLSSVAVVAAVNVYSVRISKGDLTKKEQFAIALQKCQEAAAKDIPAKCELYGKIQFVDSFPDVKVKAVTSFPDIKVKMVENFADSPGEWKAVDSFPDYKVQWVSSFPDYKVKFVDSFPGCD